MFFPESGAKHRLEQIETYVILGHLHVIFSIFMHEETVFGQRHVNHYISVLPTHLCITKAKIRKRNVCFLW